MEYVIVGIMCGVFFALGFIFGSNYGLRTKTVGTIVVDEHNPEKDLYTFEFEIPPAQINEMGKVIFKIRKIS